jgi:hypothetical protein
LEADVGETDRGHHAAEPQRAAAGQRQRSKVTQFPSPALLTECTYNRSEMPESAA